jgi:hypothetical protein
MKTVNYFGLTLTVPQNTKQIVVEKSSSGEKWVYAFNLTAELAWSKNSKSWSLLNPVKGSTPWFTYIELTKNQQAAVNKIKPSKSLIVIPRGAQQ